MPAAATARASTWPAPSPRPAATSSACCPRPDDDPIVHALHALGLDLATVPVAAAVRTNYTLTEPDGTTTKLNEPGTPLDDATPAALADRLQRARGRRPLGGALRLACRRAPRRLVRDARRRAARHRRPHRRRHVRGPAAGAARGRPGGGARPAQAEHRGARPAGRGVRGRDPRRPARRRRRGAARCTTGASPRCSLTLGGDGALLSTADGGLWSAAPPPITVRSTVGAGDSSLAGYLLADLAGAAAGERLRTAVAYGSAAASLPGPALPTPAQVDVAAVRVTDRGARPTARPHPHRPSPSRPPAGTPAESSQERSHDRTHHHRPGRAGRRPGRRQGRGRAPGWPSWSPPPAGPPAPTPCTPTPWPARRRHATGLPGGIAIPHCRSAAVTQAVAGLRPPRRRRSTSAPPTGRPTSSS